MRAHYALSLLLAACQPSTSTPDLALSATGRCAPSDADRCVALQLACSPSSGAPTCVACQPGQLADATGTCIAIPGAPVAHDFPEQTVEAGGEVASLCRSWTLHNDQEIWVSAVELVQNESSHHSNWTWADDSFFAGDDGIWPCASRKYDFYRGGADGGVLFAQSTQAAHEVEHFRAGAGFRLPPHVRIISDIHLLNASPRPVTGRAQLVLYTQPASEITTRLQVSHLEYDDIHIAPHESARLVARCSVNDAVKAGTGKPWVGKIYYALPHTHTLATAFQLALVGGPHDGEPLLSLGAYDGDAHGRTFDPAVDFTGADGLALTCDYDNTRDITVDWGTGPFEMCEGFVWTDSPVFFESRVNWGAGVDEGVQGGLHLFDGPCTTGIVTY